MYVSDVKSMNKHTYNWQCPGCDILQMLTWTSKVHYSLCLFKLSNSHLWKSKPPLAQTTTYKMYHCNSYQHDHVLCARQQQHIGLLLLNRNGQTLPALLQPAGTPVVRKIKFNIHSTDTESTNLLGGVILWSTDHQKAAEKEHPRPMSWNIQKEVTKGVLSPVDWRKTSAARDKVVKLCARWYSITSHTWLTLHITRSQVCLRGQVSAAGFESQR